MALTYLSLGCAVFAVSTVLYYQWLLADRRGKPREYKRKRWVGIWICHVATAAFLLLFTQAS
jgi:hypothetical protein